MTYDPDWSKITTLDYILKYRCTHNPERIAFIYIDETTQEKKSVTYQELDARTRSIAYDLTYRYKLIKGDRAILLYPPGIEFIAGFFGCLYAGVIAVPTYPPFNHKAAEKLLSIIENCTPKIILTDSTLSKAFKKVNTLSKVVSIPGIDYLFKNLFVNAAKTTKWITKNVSIFDTEQSKNINISQFEDPEINGNAVAFLQYTSGSTGNPKGVMVTHDNLIKNLLNIRNECKLSADDVLVSWLPTYHDMGLIDCVLQPILSGFTCIFTSPFAFLQNPYIWLQLVTEYKATITGGPNFAFAYAAKRISDDNKKKLDLSSIRFIFNGAEPIHAETLKQFYDTFKQYGLKSESLFPCYGLAEGTLLVSCMSDMKGYRTLCISAKELQQGKVKILKEQSDPDAYNIISCGYFTEDVQIVNPETCEICDTNETGEIWISGPSVTLGYWCNEPETKLVYNWQIAGISNKNKYLRTGDLGFIHDKQLYVTGRIKDLIIINGSNYYPQDIENTVINTCSLIRTGGCVAFSEVIANEEKLTIICEIKMDLNRDQYRKIVQDIISAISLEYNISLYHLVFVPPKSIYKTTSGKVQRRATKQAMLQKSLKILHEYKHKGRQESVISTQELHKVDPFAPQPSQIFDKLDQVNIDKLNSKIIQQWIKNWIAERENITIDMISEKKSINDYGLDSISIIQLAEFIKENLDNCGYVLKENISLPTIVILEDQSIAALAKNLLGVVEQGKKTIKVTDSDSKFINYDYDKSFRLSQEWIKSPVDVADIPLFGWDHLFVQFQYIPMGMLFEGEIDWGLFRNNLLQALQVIPLYSGRVLRNEQNQNVIRTKGTMGVLFERFIDVDNDAPEPDKVSRVAWSQCFAWDNLEANLNSNPDAPLLVIRATIYPKQNKTAICLFFSHLVGDGATISIFLRSFTKSVDNIRILDRIYPTVDKVKKFKSRSLLQLFLRRIELARFVRKTKYEIIVPIEKIKSIIELIERYNKNTIFYNLVDIRGTGGVPVSYIGNSIDYVYNGERLHIESFVESLHLRGQLKNTKDIDKWFYLRVGAGAKCFNSFINSEVQDIDFGTNNKAICYKIGDIFDSPDMYVIYRRNKSCYVLRADSDLTKYLTAHGFEVLAE